MQKLYTKDASALYRRRVTHKPKTMHMNTIAHEQPFYQSTKAPMWQIIREPVPTCPKTCLYLLETMPRPMGRLDLWVLPRTSLRKSTYILFAKQLAPRSHGSYECPDALGCIWETPPYSYPCFCQYALLLLRYSRRSCVAIFGVRSCLNIIRTSQK